MEKQDSDKAYKVYYYQKSHCELPDFDGTFTSETIPEVCRFCGCMIIWDDTEGKCSDCGMLFLIED